MSIAVLELRGFGVAFGERTVLDGVDLRVPGIGCTVLLGPSGTGKSTLLRTLAGFNAGSAELRTWGVASYEGAPCPGERRPALVMQNSKLLVSNVLENLVYDLPGRSTLTRPMQVEAVRPLVEACGQHWMLQCLHDSVVQRPPVEQRIIAILREAVAAPELLMVDEPTAHLDRHDAARVMQVLLALARRSALLVVLHNLQEARSLASQVVLLAGGRVQEAQAAADFFAHPLSESGRLFVANGSCPEPTREAPERAAAASAAVIPPPVYSAPSAACGPRGFVWLLPGQLAGTPWPGLIHGAAYDLRALQSVGVTQLVSLTEEPYDAAVAAPHGIGCSSYPMPDMQPPTHSQAVAICRHIDRMLQAGEVVAVHCRAGLGRTGTVLAAYWLWRARGALDAVRALEHVRRLEPGWVQSAAQVRFLEAFARAMGAPAVLIEEES